MFDENFKAIGRPETFQGEKLTLMVYDYLSEGTMQISFMYLILTCYFQSRNPDINRHINISRNVTLSF